MSRWCHDYGWIVAGAIAWVLGVGYFVARSLPLMLGGAS